MASPMKVITKVMKGKKEAMKKAVMKKSVMKKTMKMMKVSTVAKGKLMRAAVFNGRKQKTYTGLKKTDFKRNKAGKIVSRRASEAGRKSYARIKGWTVAVSKAKKNLGLTGFIAVKKGTPLYKAAKAIYDA
eukprot:TRINITY_DN1845_c0_g2_i1.p1 TRINITY_DN1845_c0_g2~~TRINITY_DN1845_c0_g2_i1.p1  ORF type:complete len:131 (-),score=33.57 TRINITY_DN1845_c0_g2_i1:193-585(-)